MSEPSTKRRDASVREKSVTADADPTPSPASSRAGTPSAAGDSKTPAAAAAAAAAATAPPPKKPAARAKSSGCCSCLFSWPALVLMILALPFVVLAIHGQLLFAGSSKPLPALPRRDLSAVYEELSDVAELITFHSGPAREELIRRCGVRAAGSVMELGFGHGAFALEVLESMADNATYEGVEICESCFHSATHTMSRYIEEMRACVRHRKTDNPEDDVAMGTSRASKFKTTKLGWRGFDRYLGLYVFDTMSPADIKTELKRAHEMMAPGGRLCVANLSRGRSMLSQFVASIWQSLYSLTPKSLGGQRPIAFQDYIEQDAWALTAQSAVAHWGVPTEVLVFRKLDSTTAIE